MRKGVSPVVAIVLLIAIAVIAAVAVWYWVSPMTSKPATAETTQKTISVVACYPDTDSFIITNSGGYTLPSTQTFDLYTGADGVDTGSDVNISYIVSVGLTPGNSTGINASVAATGGGKYNLAGGTQYFLRAAGFPDAYFTC
jgi:flagellin-like protein